MLGLDGRPGAATGADGFGQQGGFNMHMPGPTWAQPAMHRTQSGSDIVIKLPERRSSNGTTAPSRESLSKEKSGSFRLNLTINDHLGTDPDRKTPVLRPPPVLPAAGMQGAGPSPSTATSPIPPPPNAHAPPPPPPASHAPATPAVAPTVSARALAPSGGSSGNLVREPWGLPQQLVGPPKAESGFSGNLFGGGSMSSTPRGQSPLASPPLSPSMQGHRRTGSGGSITSHQSVNASPVRPQGSGAAGGGVQLESSLERLALSPDALAAAFEADCNTLVNGGGRGGGRHGPGGGQAAMDHSQFADLTDLVSGSGGHARSSNVRPPQPPPPQQGGGGWGDAGMSAFANFPPPAAEADMGWGGAPLVWPTGGGQQPQVHQQHPQRAGGLGLAAGAQQQQRQQVAVATQPESWAPINSISDPLCEPAWEPFGAGGFGAADAAAGADGGRGGGGGGAAAVASTKAGSAAVAAAAAGRAKGQQQAGPWVGGGGVLVGPTGAPRVPSPPGANGQGPTGHGRGAGGGVVDPHVCSVCNHQVGTGGGHSHDQDDAIGPEWEIPMGEIKFGPKIGQGAFGDVLRASWQGTDVAVKRLTNVAPQAREDFRREVRMLCKLRHPNVVLFMGSASSDSDLGIVMEYASNGSLYSVLRDRSVQIDMATVVRWATEVARGMTYLHTRTPPIVHRDLKSVNLLVDSDWHLKVSDFGLARTKEQTHAYTQVGTWGWMAPEVLESCPYDEKADVYSFGVVLWELITRQEPFKGLHPMQIMRAIDRGERPPIPPHVECLPAYRQLISDCWHTDAAQRPTFPGVLERLAECQAALQGPPR